ncbi:TRAP transporter substrate-binding protein [Tautonia sociabilis]|uniref:TRAP transporter substrate-binding protein n=2 Tax=Tautonia sociabilis TaxID=2080755 RepID=A0A432MKW3_9BACT|nr:TRAP transporter substrate-binding protein [Tautonia sociabilis]
MLVGVGVATSGFVLFERARGRDDGRAQRRLVLKLGHGLDTGHPVHEAMQFLADRLAEKSAGGMVIEIFPNGQLGSETECIEQVQRGALAMTKSSTAPLEGFVPEMAVVGIPYLFRDGEHLWRVLEGPIGRGLLRAGEGQGLRGLCYYDAGSRSFYTIDRPVLSPDDLSGLKIRVQPSRTALETVEALGGSPTPIPFGELYTALAQRLVDGAENNPPSVLTSRHAEVCKHYALDEHSAVPDVLLIGTRAWEALSPIQRRWLQEAADESVAYQRELWARATAEALAEIERQGVTIHRPDRSLFASRVEPMHREYLGTAVGDLIEQIKQAE